MITLFVLPVVTAGLLVSGGSDPTKWQPLSDPAGKFSIELPGKAKQQSLPIGEHKGTVFVVEVNNGAYMIAHVDLPPGTTYDYNAGVKGIADKIAGTVTTSQDVKIDGTTGKEFEMTVKNPAGHAAGRLFYVGNRLYILQALGSSVRLSDADVQQFLKSFKLIK
jgi:hypothetical protein